VPSPTSIASYSQSTFTDILSLNEETLHIDIDIENNLQFLVRISNVFAFQIHILHIQPISWYVDNGIELRTTDGTWN